MRFLLIGVLVVCSACGPLTPPKTDGGTGGGGALTGGGGGSTGGGGGSVGGGGGGGDAGDGVWDFSIMTLDPAPANSGAIVGLAETDAGVFAVSGSGRVYRSTGGPFTQLYNFPGLQPVDFEGSAAGQFFIITTQNFLSCQGGCSDAGAWVTQSVGPADLALDSLCVIDGNHVLALGTVGSFSDGVSYRWNGTMLAPSSTSLGVTQPTNCWKGASGDFFIPAEDTVLRYSPGTQAFTPEPTAPFSGWRGGGPSPGHEWVTGLGPVIAERGASSWASVFAPTGGQGSITTVVGVSPTLAFAFGSGFTSTGQAGYQFNGTSWSAMTPDVPAINSAFSSLRASDGSFYVGGYDANQFPVIIRGARR